MVSVPQPVVHDAATKLTDWLTAAGGLLVFLATVALAFLAYRQMRTLAAQAKAAQDQVDVMRKVAADEAATVSEQIRAAVEQGEAIREAARAQLQPIVFAHADSVRNGPDDDYDVSDGEVGFPYRLSNEGTGIALNIRHGIEIAGAEFEFGRGMQWRVLRPGQAEPALGRPFVLRCDEGELPDRWRTLPRNYWTRFENVFGEHFKISNPNYPEQPASFTRIDHT